MNNYPPGVTGAEPHLTGEYLCDNCGATLPEDPNCPECDRGEMEFVEDAAHPGTGVFTCECGHTLPFDFDTCPGGCRQPEFDAERDL